MKQPEFSCKNKSNIGVRTWLLLDSLGNKQLLEAGKYSIMRRTGIPGRDFRVLDPFLSCSSTVLARDKAIVVNLDHIKAIIMSNQVLLLNSKHPFVEPFSQQLERKILCFYQASKQQEERVDDSKSINKGTSQEPQQQLLTSKEQLDHSLELQEKESKQETKLSFMNHDGSSTILPFEFIALEACLENACSNLDEETDILSLEGNSALDKLISHINTFNLQRVRQMKSRLVGVIGRAQKIKDKLERLLDDDDDMAEMYLTKKMSQWHFEDVSTSSTNEGSDYLNSDVDEESDDLDSKAVNMEDSDSCKEVDVENNNTDKAKNILFSAPDAVGTESHRTNFSLQIKESSVGDLEKLLEAYLLKIEGTLNKLSTLREYIDDTEGYIEIMLDEKQNELLELGIILSTTNIVLLFFIVIAGILGMNIRIPFYFVSPQQGNPVFIWYCLGNVVGVIICLALAFGFYRYKGYI